MDFHNLGLAVLSLSPVTASLKRVSEEGISARSKVLTTKSLAAGGGFSA